ncbi:MFS transporter [Amycolatopsis sp. NPDC088138]|uniref:MFS transporter n=1 Tax=Amycolatopsis sp. NPDC088138 TaxID=3363938 RepID=UPI0038167849
MATGLLCLVQVLVALEFSIVTIAVPALRSGMGLAPDQVQWLLSAYAIALGFSLLFAGRLADVLRARHTLLAGMVLFTAASASAAGTQDFGWLVAVRAASPWPWIEPESGSLTSFLEAAV